MKRSALARGWAVALGLVFVLTGCQLGGGTQSANETLTWWSFYNKGEPGQKIDEKIITDFQKAYPNITVKVLWGGRDILSKVRSSLLAGNPPDLVDKDGDEMASAIITNSQAVPLDDIVNANIYNENKKISDVVPAGFLDQFKVNGHYYLIPYDVFTSGVFYNGTQFSKLGLSAPTTWDDFLTLVKQLKAQGITPLGSDNNQSYPAYYYYWAAVRHLGAGGLSRVVGDKSGNSFSDPGILQAAKDIQTLTALHPFEQGFDASKWPAAEQAWAQGKEAMYITGDWLPGEVQSTVAPDFQFRMFPWPQVPGGQTSTEVYGIGFSIPKGAKHADAAKKFISFFMNKDELSPYVTDAKLQTSRSDLPAPAALQDVKTLFDKNWPVNRIYDGLQFLYPGWFQTVFLPLDDKLFYSQVTPDQFVAQLKSQSVTYWQSHSS